MVVRAMIRPVLPRRFNNSRSADVSSRCDEFLVEQITMKAAEDVAFLAAKVYMGWS